MSLSKLVAKRDKLVAELAKVNAEIATEEASSVNLSKVVEGAVITFDYGRAENKKELVGTVLARKAQEKGAELVRVVVGEGFDVQAITIFISNVKSIVSSPADEVAAE